MIAWDGSLKLACPSVHTLCCNVRGTAMLGLTLGSTFMAQPLIATLKLKVQFFCWPDG